MQVMEAKRTAGTDSRGAQQARELQTLLAGLMQPPMKPPGRGLADIELSPREITVLLLLGDKGDMIMTDLASALGAPLSTVTRMMDRLEQKGMIERFRSDEDRRIVLVREGAQGRMLRKAIRRIQLEKARRLLEPLTAGEREILLELMAKMVRPAGVLAKSAKK